MSDAPHHDAADATPPNARFDGDIDLKAVVLTGVGVAVGTVVSALLMWWMMAGFNAFDRHVSGPASPTAPGATVTAQPPPPEPRLESAPPVNLAAVRAQEDEVLDKAAWSASDPSEQGGRRTLRLPISVALDVLARKGIPHAQPAPPETAGQLARMEVGGHTDLPSTGTIMPLPGEGMGHVGPEAAAPMSQSGMAMLAGLAGHPAPRTGAPSSPPSGPAAIPPDPLAPLAQNAGRPATPPPPPGMPVMPPPGGEP